MFWLKLRWLNHRRLNRVWPRLWLQESRCDLELQVQAVRKIMCTTAGGCPPSCTPASIHGAGAADCPAEPEILHVAPDVLGVPQSNGPAPDPKSSWEQSPTVLGESSNHSAVSMRSSISNSVSWTAAVITQPSHEPDEPDLQGLILQERTEEDMNPSGNLATLAIVLAVTRRYPKHCLHGLYHCIFPLMGALLFTVTSGFILQEQVAALGDDFEGSLWEAHTSSELPMLLGALDYPVRAIEYSGTYGMIAALVSALWSLRAVRPSLIRLLLPSFALANLLWMCVVVNRHLQVWNAVLDFWMEVATYYLVPSLGVLSTLICVGTAVHNPVFGFGFAGIFIALLIVCFVVNRSFGAILDGSDEVKAVFVGILNPVLFELLAITPSRFIGRSLRHNHPSSSFLCTALPTCAKQLLGRCIIATVKNPAWVLCLAVANGLGEFTLRLTMRARDRILYWRIFGRSLQRNQRFRHSRATEQFRNPRNECLRADNSAFETMSEVVAIWNGVAMVLSLDMSKDGRSSPTLQDAVRAGVTQTLVELLTDYLSIVAIAAFLNIDLLARMSGRYWYWSFPTAPFVVFSSAMLFNAFSVCLCRSPHLDGSTWMLCSS